MAPEEEMSRMSIREALELARVPEAGDSHKDADTQRFMSCRPAWSPGEELPGFSLSVPDAFKPGHTGARAFGGCVYAMASLAAARVVEQEDAVATANGKGKRSIHVSHGEAKS